MSDTERGEFQPIRKKRLSDEVAAQIRDRIAAGELRPGDKLPAERQMAETFAVSRGAVREGLRSLELAGVVTLTHGAHGGAFITTGDPGVMADSVRDMFHLGGVSLDELMEARIWIETMVSRIVAERGTDDDFAALTENVDRAEALYKAGRYDDKIDINVEFHMILARATHNRMMVMMMGALMEVMREFSHQVGGEQHDLTLQARRKFLTALRARDGDAAAQNMREHVVQLQKRYAAIVRAQVEG